MNEWFGLLRGARNPTLPRVSARTVEWIICEAIRSISHEIGTKSVECVGIACLGEDVGDIVARADV